MVTSATHPGGGEERRDHASARVGDRVAASPTRAALAPHDTMTPRCRDGERAAQDPPAGHNSSMISRFLVLIQIEMWLNLALINQRDFVRAGA